MKKTVLISATVALLLNCAPAKIINPTQADAERMRSKFPEYTLADINEGKKLYEANCGNCHGLKDPTKKTADKWEHEVPKMAAKINKKEVKLTDAQQELILKYLVTFSKAQ